MPINEVNIELSNNNNNEKELDYSLFIYIKAPYYLLEVEHVFYN